MDEAEGLFQKLGGQPPEKEWDAGLSDVTEAGLYPESMKEVILVEDYPRETKDGLPVQLIFVNWKTHRITARFDIGICRIATDGTTLTVDEGFDEDVMNKALNIRRCNNKWMLGASISRIIRLLKKYPDWTIQLEGVKIKEAPGEGSEGAAASGPHRLAGVRRRIGLSSGTVTQQASVYRRSPDLE